MSFAETQWFETVCGWARWDEEWFRKIFFSVDKQGEDVRRDITAQVTRMLKSLAKLNLD